jgi:heme oxygenase (biliverdin-producing, ferredoxin)
VGLSAALHDRTRALHTEAERSGVMAALLRGQASRGAYLRLLVSLHAIYDALERGLDAHATHPVLAPMHEPAFARRAALEADLGSILGDDWASRTGTPPLAHEYARHLDELAREHPVHLLAHAWLRYLGDLNGGQIVARLMRSSPALASMPGSFYEFPGLAEPRAAGAAWKARLDALPLDAAMHDALVVEASEGFRRHIALFHAIADQDRATPSPSAA